MQLLRVFRGQRNLWLVSYFSEVGDVGRSGWNTPEPYEVFFASGAMRVVFPSYEDFPQWFRDRCDSGVMQDFDPGSSEYTFRAPYLGALQANAAGVLIYAVEPRSVAVCIWPLDRAFLEHTFSPLGERRDALIDRILDAPGRQGPFEGMIDFTRADQVDPATLVHKDGDVGILDAELVESAALNDLRQRVGEENP